MCSSSPSVRSRHRSHRLVAGSREHSNHPRLYRGRLGHQRASFAEIGPCRLSSLLLPRRGTISSLQDWSFEVRINCKPFTNTRHLMHKEQQDDNKTKEIRITQDNGSWKVMNHKGRTLDATRTRAEAEESVAILEQFPEYRGRWP